MAEDRASDARDVVVRPAKVEDAGRLAELAAQLGYPTTAAEVAARLGRYARGAAARVFVAESGGRALGWTSVEVADHFYAPKCVEISGLVVDAEARGRGIGARLLRAVEAWAAGKGLPSVRLRANVVRTDAHRFYEREGFEKKKTQFVFEKRV